MAKHGATKIPQTSAATNSTKLAPATHKVTIKLASCIFFCENLLAACLNSKKIIVDQKETHNMFKLFSTLFKSRCIEDEDANIDEKYTPTEMIIDEPNKLFLQGKWSKLSENSVKQIFAYLMPVEYLNMTLACSWCAERGPLYWRTLIIQQQIDIVKQISDKYMFSTIRIDKCYLSDEIMGVFVSKMANNLTSLSLHYDAHVSTNALNLLISKCSKLSSISLVQIKNLDGKVLEHASQNWTKLSKIEIVGCKRVDGTSLNSLLLANTATLQRLHLQDLPLVKEELMLSLENLINLTDLNISQCYVKQLPRLKHLNQLMRLNIGCMTQTILDAQIEQLVPHMKQLIYINISGNNLLTDAAVFSIAENCGQLRSIDAEQLNRITMNSVKKLEAQCKWLEVINVSDCEQIH